MKTAFCYTVLSGDTLSSIAAGISAGSGVTCQAIESANPGVEPTALKIGMLINIPAKGGSETVLRYTIMEGDTFSKISEQLALCPGLTYRQIEADNPGIDPNMLAIGQVINIPATTADSVPSSVPDPVPEPAPGQEQTGFWRWTWSSSPQPPSGCNMGLAFSGWTDVSKALQDSSAVYTSVPDLKYITLGGGNENGAFHKAGLQKITEAINADKFISYSGIAYDVEEGDSGLSELFAKSFEAAKTKKLKVLVTISHSAPYGITDAHTLMESFFKDSNIDFLSPQLYTTGRETKNDYATSGKVTWNMYAGARAKIIPSIVKADMYADAKSYFAKHDVKLEGFVQWSQG